MALVANVTTGALWLEACSSKADDAVPVILQRALTEWRILGDPFTFRSDRRMFTDAG